jgi:hypothetical protein
MNSLEWGLPGELLVKKVLIKLLFMKLEHKDLQYGIINKYQMEQEHGMNKNGLYNANVKQFQEAYCINNQTYQ